MFYKYVTHKTDLPIDGIYNFYVQELRSVDGESFFHVGYTKYFQTEEAAEAYRAEMQAARPLPERPKKSARPVLDGKYYYFDCMNAAINGGVYPEREFASADEAAKTAADYEATLYLYEYDQGRRVNSTIIYDPTEF